MDSRKKVQCQAPTSVPVPLVIPKNSVIETCGISRGSTEPIQARVKVMEQIGSGSFGLVYRARLDGIKEPVALKQIPHDPQFCQREAEILDQLVDHSNIVRLIMHSCVELGNPPQSCYILIMEFMPMTLHDYINRHQSQMHYSDSLLYVRILSYQIFRGLGHLHTLGICHRDIKPENLLLDNRRMVLKLGDFGSAKFLVPQEPSLSYICSRLYRAPELFAKCELYSCSVDIWSAGCVLAELLKGSPLFMSIIHEENQLGHIINTLGTEGLERAPEILSHCGDIRNIISTRPSWDILLHTVVPQDLSDLLNSCLVYESAGRILPIVACAHPSFDELRVMDTLDRRMPNGRKLPPLFNFSDQELGIDQNLWLHLLPLYLMD
nr:glycogen synthase kinase-3 alpha [Drosophila bipectinata]